MKTFVCILFVAFFNAHTIEKATFGGHKLTLHEAERILGESCQLKESVSSLENGRHKYTSTYLANSTDEKIDRRVALNFMFESYGAEIDAKKMFGTFKASNQSYAGFELLPNLGDEAFFHSDNKNFYLIIARKGNEMIRLKVNKITEKTSLAELKKIAADVIDRV
ncbi:hypothetical protein WBJ53_21595 [Spirosoma sp. SC4-14]|uniref:hypothetical protein n=1 Tax=Spirosoma sp. SC4-14 TaxID=3128900 RepID=UPI0030D46E44